MRRDKNRQKLARYGVTLLMGLMWSSAQADKEFFQYFDTSNEKYQNATISGHINYAAVGASFRLGNGDGGVGGEDNQVDFRPGPALCGVKNEVPGPTWGGIPLVTSSGANVATSDRTAAQTVPPGSTVKAAYLYWTGSSGQGSASSVYADNQVTFRIGTQAFTITADSSNVWTAIEPNGNNYSRAYGAFKALDGAALDALKANPNAALGMDNLTLNNNRGDEKILEAPCGTGVVFGGWSMYIVYENERESYKSMYLKHGLKYSSGTSTTVKVDELLIPDAGNDKVSTVTVMASDGDPNNTGDKLTINLGDTSGTSSSFAAQTARRTASNFFRGFISYGYQDGTTSEIQANTTPNVSTTLGGGLDFVTLDISSRTNPTTKSIEAVMASDDSSEMFLVHNIALLNTVNKSDVRVKKQVSSQTGGQVGDTVVYRMDVDNSNSPLTEAYAVRLEDTLPAGLDFVSTRISFDGGASFSPITPESVVKNADGTTSIVYPKIHRLEKDGTVYDENGNVLGTQALVYEMTTRLNGEAAGELVNKAKVGTASYESSVDQDNNNDSTPITVNFPALNIIKSDADQTFARGGQGIYTLTVKNTGNLPTTGNITVKEVLPAGMTFASITTDTGSVTGGTVGGSGTQTFSLSPAGGALQPGQSVKLTLTVNVSGNAANPLVNRVSVGDGGTPPAPDPTKCVDSSTPTRCDVESTPTSSTSYDLAVMKTQTTPATIKAGDAIEYSITLVNNSSTNVRGASLLEALPVGLSNVTVSCTALQSRYNAGYYQENDCDSTDGISNVDFSSRSISSGNITFSNINLRANAVGGVRFTIRGTATQVGSLVNTATVMIPNGTADSNPVNNTSSVTTTVQSLPPLECKNTMYTLIPGSSPEVRTLSTTGTLGADTLWKVPATSNSASLGITPDGKRLFAAEYTEGKVHYKDVTTGIQGNFTLPGYSFSSADTSTYLLRMAIGPDGTGYLTTGDKYWTFSTTGTPSVLSGPIVLTSTDSSVNTSGNGDIIFNSVGEVFIIKSPLNGANEGTGYVDVFKISGSDAIYYGRVTDTADLGASFGGAAALSSGIYLASFGTGAKLSTLDLASYEASTVSSLSTGSSDLTSCYYPVLAPTLAVTKSVQKVGGSAGTEIKPGDTLEYTIVTRNNGTISTSGAKLQDTVPAGTTYVAGSTTMNFAAVADRTDVTGNATMPFSVARTISSPDASTGIVEVDSTPTTVTTSSTDADDNEVVVKFRVKVDSSTTEVRNQASVVHVDGSTPSNETVTPTGKPELTIVKSVDTSFISVAPDTATTAVAPLPDSQISPQQIKYTITVTNTGTTAASNIKVLDTLPTGLTYASSTVAYSTSANTYGSPSPLTRTGTDQNLEFALNSLSATEPNKSAQIVVTADVDLQANTNQTALLNKASTLATNIAEKDSNEVRTDILYPKLLKRVRNVGSDKTLKPAFGTTAKGTPGDYLEYCLPYNNYGTTPMVNYKISDTLQNDTTYDSLSSNSSAGVSAPTVEGQTVTFDFGTLPANTGGQACFYALIK